MLPPDQRPETRFAAGQRVRVETQTGETFTGEVLFQWWAGGAVATRVRLDGGATVDFIEAFGDRIHPEEAAS